MLLCCCARCGRKVHCDDQKVSCGRVWHSFCFSCRVCKKLLDYCTVRSHQGELYCGCCLEKCFGCGKCGC